MDKVKAIVEFRECSNLVFQTCRNGNICGKYINNLSSIIEPLRSLIKFDKVILQKIDKTKGHDFKLVAKKGTSKGSKEFSKL